MLLPVLLLLLLFFQFNFPPPVDLFPICVIPSKSSRDTGSVVCGCDGRIKVLVERSVATAVHGSFREPGHGEGCGAAPVPTRQHGGRSSWGLCTADFQV